MDIIAEGLFSINEDVVSGVTGFFEDPLESISSGISSLGDGLFDLGSNIIDGITDFLADPLGSIISLIEGITDTIVSIIDPIVSAITSIVEPILSGFGDLLSVFFVPDTDAINTKLSSVRERFGFVDSVMETGEAFGSLFSRSTLAEPEPPAFYVDLGAAEGDINFGGKVKILDLSWYAPYKPTVDALVSSFLWVFFAWRVYSNLPGIISGTSLSRDDIGKVSEVAHVFETPGKYERKPKKGRFEK